MAILLTMTDDKGHKVDVNIDLEEFQPDVRGEYLDYDQDGLAVVNAVADALKKINEMK